jgi:hypothetical protein
MNGGGSTADLATRTRHARSVISTAVLIPLIAASGYATGQLYALAARRGRRGVRSSAHHARAALIVALLFTAAVIAANLWAAPLLLPAVAAVRLTLPRLSRLIQLLYAEPWGPSDPAVRRRAADPALVAPAAVLLLGALAAGFTSPWTAAAMSYGVAAVGGGALVLLARRRRARLARYRVGTLRRVLLRPRDETADLPQSRHPVAA